MQDIKDEWQIIPRLIQWAEKHDDIRALLLTSSRANPQATLDKFSDYDVIFITEDIRPYQKDENWLNEYGNVLVIYRDPVEPIYGFDKFIRVTQYESGLKIDFSIWPVGLLKHIAALPELPDYIDDGYKILLDKDGITKGMKPPTCKAYIPKPPTEIEFLHFIEGFFSNVPYVAKHIRRGDVFPLKIMLNYMRYEKLRKLLEWKSEAENNWSLKSGVYGKGLQKHLPPSIFKKIDDTLIKDDWEALFRIIKLFSQIAREVGNDLGYAYPEELELKIIKYAETARGKYK